jgi:hypothetical protein
MLQVLWFEDALRSAATTHDFAYPSLLLFDSIEPVL